MRYLGQHSFQVEDRANSWDAGPILPKLVLSSVDFTSALVGSGPKLAELAPNLVELTPTLVEVGSHLSRIGIASAKFANIGVSLTNVGSRFVNKGPDSANTHPTNRLGGDAGRIWPRFRAKLNVYPLLVRRHRP